MIGIKRLERSQLEKWSLLTNFCSCSCQKTVTANKQKLQLTKFCSRHDSNWGSPNLKANALPAELPTELRCLLLAK